MGKQTVCEDCGEHKPQMVYRGGVWRCSDCERGNDGVRVVVPPTLIGLPSKEHLRRGLTHLPATGRSWTR